MQRVVQKYFPQNLNLYEFGEFDEFTGHEVRPLLDEIPIRVQRFVPYDAHPVSSVRLLEPNGVHAGHVADFRVKLRAERTLMEDTIEDRADYTAYQSASDDRNQQRKHGNCRRL